MNKRRYRLAIVGALVAIAAGAVVAYAGGDTDSSPVAQLQTHPGPEALLRAQGVSASQAQPALTLNNGEAVGVIDSGGVRCFTLSVGAHVSGACSSETNIANGDAINVHDECSGKNSMAIYGLAPVGAVEVRLENSDGTSESTTVVKGAFSFAGTNPAAGAAYPTGVRWLGAGGSSLGTAPLPVSAGQFCLPTS
jgi:hypothetical protein